MAFTLAQLLIHNDEVPCEAREALREASSGPPEHRAQALEHAARVIHRDTDLDCGDVRELVGLEPGGIG